MQNYYKVRLFFFVHKKLFLLQQNKHCYLFPKLFYKGNQIGWASSRGSTLSKGRRIIKNKKLFKIFEICFDIEPQWEQLWRLLFHIHIPIHLQAHFASQSAPWFLHSSGNGYKASSNLAQKMLKMTISTSVWGAQHPIAGRNIQQPRFVLGTFQLLGPALPSKFSSPFWLNLMV